MDVQVTRTNCLTGGHASAAMIPVHFPCDREILDAVLPIVGLTDPPNAKLMWIHNTLDVAEVECSAAYLADARTKSNLTILTDPRPLPLDSRGMLPAMTSPACREPPKTGAFPVVRPMI